MYHLAWEQSNNRLEESKKPGAIQVAHETGNDSLSHLRTNPTKSAPTDPPLQLPSKQ